MAIPVMIPPLPIVGDLGIPEAVRGMVILAHGSGSSRFSVRNQAVAAHLRDEGFGTLLLDLLTGKEAEQPDFRFDIELLASRMRQATDWVREYPLSRHLPIAYFGASTGAAAALLAAAEPDSPVYAVVSRGGRPELAASALRLVRAATLLLVGGHDASVLGGNQWALGQLNRQSRLEIVEGATHLFAEPGTLKTVARMAGRWFLDHLPG